MEQRQILVGDVQIPVYIVDAVVVGSGCAGFNAADWLHTFGVTNIAMVTEGMNKGTSRNTGSDKQTYYKISMSGTPDSVMEMASDLFACGGVHGDTALAEAANSARCFLKLANLGVAFPTDAYGQYVGYKTDHDPRQRASSAGPLTSKYMTQVLEKAVQEKNIPILNCLTVVKLLVEDGEAKGLLCVDKEGKPVLICAGSVILATGGPAGCYEDSVYPLSQTGMSGLALEAGAAASNLAEWQYGLASTKFRWNVSGTYQQVLPRYISVDAEGVEREILPMYFSDPVTALNLEFLKGYQWPFDSEKCNASSLVDIVVYHEHVVLGRRVFMDFRTDPTGLENGFEALNEDTYQYLYRSGALMATPIARLEKMNPAAIDLYRRHGIDLYNEPLEIAVCAQHHNGGIAVDANWQSTIEKLYVVGEAAGTFGARRPGGSALNSTQVGSLRAAEHIAYTLRPKGEMTEDFEILGAFAAERMFADRQTALENSTGEAIADQRLRLQRKMSGCAAQMRNLEQIRQFRAELEALYKDYFNQTKMDSLRDSVRLYKNRDMIITQMVVLQAMETAAQAFGTHGGSVVLQKDGVALQEPLSQYVIAPRKEQKENMWMETKLTEAGTVSALKPVRPIPNPDNWFETVWAEYRKVRS